MSIAIRKINTYRDGGSIGIDCFIAYNGKIIEGNQPLITIDYSLPRTETYGEWFIGWKHKGGKMITDENLKTLIKEEFKSHIEQEQIILERISKNE
jgi:hypothetical protein